MGLGEDKIAPGWVARTLRVQVAQVMCDGSFARGGWLPRMVEEGGSAEVTA